MKRLSLITLVLLFAVPTLATPPNWDLTNTYWTARARDVVLGYTFDGNIRFFTQDRDTGAFTARVQYLPPNNNPLGQYTVSGTVTGDTFTFTGRANVPGVGVTDIVWLGTVRQNGARLDGQFAYWDWIWEVWVVFDWWTTSGGPARAIVRTFSIGGRAELEQFQGDVTRVPIIVQLRNAGSTTPIRTVELYLDSSGSYTLRDVPNGTYDLAFKASHWLKTVARNVRVNNASVAGVNVSLKNGDCDGDNEVTLFDFGRIVAAFGTMRGETGFDPDADLDGDDEVTLFDFGILVGNFGLIGEE